MYSRCPVEHLEQRGFEKMLERNLSEGNWQKLFNENPFILNMAFGYPIIKIQGQASVGGRKISGDGDKITDFLVKNNISNNVAVIEIKTPNTKLVNKSVYRKSVSSPSTELKGAVTQMLDQINNFQKSFPLFKDTSKIFDIETYYVHGVLIIGRSLTDNDQQKSFELFRGNSKNITIVTFDELLIKLQQLLLFIRPDSSTV